MSVALNAMRREAGLTAMLWSFASDDVLRNNQYCAPMVGGHFLIGGPNSLGGQSRERGGNLSPYDDIRGKFQIRPSELSFRGGAGYPRAWFTPIAISSHWGTIVRLGELILMLKNLKVKCSCHGTFI